MVLNDKTKEVKPPGRDANGMLTPGIHVLPQDGMVCFVPPKTMIGLIPNFYEGKVGVPFTGNAPHIPNASPVIQSFQYHPLPKPVEK